ncbi:hypothetical protein CPB84DRAFT_1764263 [Gymnopilus junonius]|uniref:RING-type domain-containing protein n=1 Tax=Gymnopilus junonius TaxID=109634 RepID=A0A9P5NVL8_GYMJU|nr:hypothetical protein CPB84DRAFT_1764263 [Gymnopilus junonius]
MPVSTRQATPGPSNAVLHSANTKKRSGSEIHDDARSVKKIKVDGDAALSHISSVNGKDKKKKKRKKKKRSSVVVSVTHSERREGSRSKSRSVPPSPVKQTPVLRGLVPSGGSANEEDMESVLSASDKGKGKANSNSPAQRSSTLRSDSPQLLPLDPESSTMVATQIDSAAQLAEIAQLKEQLATQTKLLERHQTHFSNHQQSLTCQICLDLMHKPYALAPCGHTTCYPCLVRWFTAPQDPEMPGMNANPAPENPENIDTLLDSAQARRGTFTRRRKKCPVCRAVVIDRPIEMWGIKGMVVTLVRSGLADLPVAVEPSTPAEEGGNTDPWRNIFRKSGPGHRFGGVFDALFGPPVNPPEQGEGDRERMGWYDAEDGGIYRCIACYHEIWDGICTACRRRYPGHGGHSDDEDEDEDEPDWGDVRGHFWSRPDIFGESDDLEDDEDDDDDDDGLPDLHLHPYLRRNPFTGLYPGHPLAAHGLIEEVGDEDDDEENEENSDYEGSFIDDGNGDHGEENDDDDDDELDILDTSSRVLPPPRNQHRQVLFDDDGEEEDPGLVARQLGRGARSGSRNLILDSESEGSIEFPVDQDENDEEEDDDDEMPSLLPGSW